MISPFPFSWIILSVFFLDTRCVLSCLPAVRLGVQPLFLMKRKRIQMRIRSGGGEVATFLQLGVWVFTQTLQMKKKTEPKRIKFETFCPQRNQLEARASLTEEETVK